MSLECLDNIIALTRGNDCCFGIPVVEPPTTGIYIDELHGFGLLKFIFCNPNCPQTTAEQAYQDALNLLESAKTQLVLDINTLIKNNFKKETWLNKKTLFGDKLKNYGHFLSKDKYQILKICPADYKGGVLKIHRIGLHRNRCETIKIYDEQFCELYSYDISSDKKLEWLDVNICLPLEDRGCEACYYIVTEAKTRIEKTYDWCGCSSKRPTIFESFRLTSYTSDILEDKETGLCCTAKKQYQMFGIALDMELDCNIICCIDHDYLAMTLGYLWAALIMSHGIAQNWYSDTKATKEQWLGNLKQLRASYADRLANIPIPDSPCTCPKTTFNFGF